MTPKETTAEPVRDEEERPPLVVCVSSSPHSEQVLRVACQRARARAVRWSVVHVEMPGRLLSDTDRDRALRYLRLAERLGAEARIIEGTSVSRAVLAYARVQAASTVIVGAPGLTRWRERLFGTVVDQLIRQSGDIEVIVVGGSRPGGRDHVSRDARVWGRGYLLAALIVGLASGVCLLLQPAVAEADLIMTYLIAVVVVSYLTHRGPSLLAAGLSVAAFDFLFVRPYYTFAVHDARYLLTFAVMAGVGMTVSSLTARVKAHARQASERERHSAALYHLTRRLAGHEEVAHIAATALQCVDDVFGTTRSLLGLRSQEGGLGVHPPASFDELNPGERRAFDFALVHEVATGAGHSVQSASRYTFLPLHSGEGTPGVLGVRTDHSRRLSDPEQRHLLESFATQIGMVLDRASLSARALEAQRVADREKLRSSLLSSVSHDLRTPLGSILGTVSFLLTRPEVTDWPDGQRHLSEVLDEAERLSRLLENMLQMTRIEGGVPIKKEWHLPEEVVGTALRRMRRLLEGRAVQVAMDPTVDFVPFDELLVELVLVNLLENACRYTPSGTSIEIAGRLGGDDFVLEVSDRGPGFTPAEVERVFEKFYRGEATRPGSGAGLGLAICLAVVRAHDGAIAARNRAEGKGAVISMQLPLVDPALSQAPRLSSVQDEGTGSDGDG